MYTAAHNYHTTYLNQLLIHAQRPDATACATMKYWNEQAHRKVILASSVLYELIGPACAKLSLYLSGSYSNRLDDIVTETVKCDGHEPENEVERLIRQIQAIQKELPAHNDPFLEDEQAYDEAAYEHYALTGYPQVSYQNTRRKADIWTL